MNKKILITGGNSFIFSYFIRKALFNKSNYNYVNLDYCQNHNALNNIYVNRGAQLYVGDITDKHLVNVVFEVEKPDIVIHAAAQTFVDNAIKDVNPFIHSNVLGTQTIIDACLKWKTEKLIYISTDEVMGQLEENQKPWKEDAPLAPRNAYAASKAAGEMLVIAAHNTHGLKYNITRSCNNYGPRQHPRSFIPKIIKSIINNTPMPIYGQGKQLREWIYVEDNCNAINKIIEEGKENEIYNISSNYEFSNIEVFHEICNIMGKGHELLTFVPERLGHDFRYAIDSTKIRNLGWKPTYKFKEGLKRCINWYLDNKWFFNQT